MRQWPVSPVSAISSSPAPEVSPAIAASAWSSDAARPKSVALYALAATTTSATAIVPLTSTGAVNVSPIFATHLAVSVEGWYAPVTGAASASTPGVTSLVTPTRRLVRMSLAQGATKTVKLPLPAGDAAALVNLVASGPAGTAVVVWPSGARMPSVASMILRDGTVRTSRVTPVGAGNAISLHNGGRASVQVVVDIAGWA